jgi:hypothetical protein
MARWLICTEYYEAVVPGEGARDAMAELCSREGKEPLDKNKFPPIGMGNHRFARLYNLATGEAYETIDAPYGIYDLRNTDRKFLRPPVTSQK